VVSNPANNTSVYRKNKVIKMVETNESDRHNNIYLYEYKKESTVTKKMNRSKNKMNKGIYKKKSVKNVNQKNQTRKAKSDGRHIKYACPWKMRYENRNTQKECKINIKKEMENRQKMNTKKAQGNRNKRKEIINKTCARKHTWCTDSTLGKCTDSTLGKCTAPGTIKRSSVRVGARPESKYICVDIYIIRKYRAKNRVNMYKCKVGKNVMLIERSKMSNEPMEVPEAGGGDGVKGDGGKGNIYIQSKSYMRVYADGCVNRRYYVEPCMIWNGPLVKRYKIGKSTQRVCNWYRRHGE
jgi:hypothetical protein